MILMIEDLIMDSYIFNNKKIRIMGQIFSMGRSLQCDIRVNEFSVSYFHAMIMQKPNGICIKDNNSRYGPLVLVQSPLSWRKILNTLSKQAVLASTSLCGTIQAAAQLNKHGNERRHSYKRDLSMYYQIKKLWDKYKDHTISIIQISLVLSFRYNHVYYFHYQNVIKILRKKYAQIIQDGTNLSIQSQFQAQVSIQTGVSEFN